MTELIRRLDRLAVRGPRRVFPSRGAWLARAEEHAASVAEFPITGFRRAGTFTPGAPVRRMVPRARHRARPHRRPLREHLRAAGRGDGGRPGADRQPARDQSRQVAGADRAAARGVRLRARGRRQLCRRRRPPGDRTRAALAHSRRAERDRRWRAYTPAAPRPSHPPDRHRREPAAREGARRAVRGRGAGAAALSRRGVRHRRRRPAPAGARGAGAGARHRVARAVHRARRRRARPARVERPLRAAVALGGVPEQRARGDGERPADRRHARRRDRRADREPAHGRARVRRTMPGRSGTRSSI